MKTRRLSEIDLARLAALPAGPQLENALRAYNTGGGAWSYDPVRASTSDILGASTPLYGPLDSLPWDKIKKQIENACRRGAVQAKANTEVAKVLFDEARRMNWSAVKFPMGHLPVAIGETVRYWSDVLLADENGPFIPFFDHRRKHGIAKRSEMQIVFSMQHLWVRERHLDLAEAQLAVVQFPCGTEGRSICIEFHNESDLMSYEELNGRVRVVYETGACVGGEGP
jgi:hypothetical protein